MTEALALLLELASPATPVTRARAVALAPIIERAPADLRRLLAAVAWKESNYNAAAVGKRGEVGAWQVAPTGWARTLCRDGFRTPRANCRCAARILRYGARRCGSVEGALRFYGSGNCAGGARYAARVMEVINVHR